MRWTFSEPISFFFANGISLGYSTAASVGMHMGPAVDFVALAGSLSVPAERATTPATVRRQGRAPTTLLRAPLTQCHLTATGTSHRR